MGFLAKLLFVVIVVMACIVWVRRQGRSSHRITRLKMKRQNRETVESIVPCAYCGLYLPRNEALAGREERFYCCEAHQDADRQNQ